MAKNYWKSSNGVIVKILPFFERGYGFQSIFLHEKIGGEIASGRVILMDDSSSEAEESVNDLDPITIEIYNESPGRILKVSGFITNRFLQRNFLTLDFLVIPNKQFAYDWNSEADGSHGGYKGVRETIERLYPGAEFRNDIKSSIETDVSFLQNGVSDLDFLIRLSAGFKKRTIFCLGLEGYMIKEIIDKDSRGNDERTYVEGKNTNILSSGGPNKLKTSEDIGYHDKIYKEPINTWELEEVSKNNLIKPINPTATIIDKTYHIFHNSVQMLIENKSYNDNIMNSGFFGTIEDEHSNVIPDYRIGDVVFYQRSDKKEKKKFYYHYLVAEMTYIIRQGRGSMKDKTQEAGDFSVQSTLVGLVDPSTGKLLGDLPDNPYTDWKNSES